MNGDFNGKERKKIPSPSGAGLVRYFEEETKGPKLSPEQVVIMTVILAVFCIALRFSYS
nr:preprotein translocase subunit Sec61beta [Methanobacterium formicicum]